MSRDAIDRGHEEWLAAMKANDAQALGRIVADDVILMPPQQRPVRGRQGVIDWFADVVRQARTVGVVIPEREVAVAGDVGIERGSFTWTVAPAAGGSVDDHGSFVAIWAKQSDGSWKVKSNIWNSMVPSHE